MHRRIAERIQVLLLMLCVPSLAVSQGSTRYQCSYGELQRRVEIHTEPGVSVPCEVHYYKDMEAPGERQVLWSAASDAAYCERKTAELIGKLQSWGWTCRQSDPAAGDAAADGGSGTKARPESPPSDPADSRETAEGAETAGNMSL